MYHRRNQSDSKATTILGNSTSSRPITNHAQTMSSLQSSTTGRISIYSMREKVILNNMTRMTDKLTPDAQTKVINRFHQEMPAIRHDGYLTYYLYITIQNLIHLNVIHILLYHTIFWLDPTKSKHKIVHLIEKLENTEYEQTLFIVTESDRDDIIRSTIHVHLINKYVYITLICVSTIELISASIWTLQKKLSFFIQRSPKWRNRLKFLLILIIICLYLTFIAWLFFHTFITHYLTSIIFIVVLIHFILLTILDKPNLFRDIPINLFKGSFLLTNITRRKHHRHPPSWYSMSSSMIINSIGRFSHRSSSSMQSRKVHSLFSSFRWSSISEQNLDIHECSTLYEEIREEADNQWRMVVRRMALQFYRTFASFIFFDLIPYKMMDTNILPTDNSHYIILIIIFALSTFLTHSVFLFPVKFQANLYYLSNHLGQWRLKSSIRTNAIHEWSSECNSYTYGNIIKLSSNTDKHFIAIQDLSNAAHPQSISHSILYRLFNDITYFLRIQFILCCILIIFQLFWIIPGKCGFETLISILIILNSSYTIFKIIRDRLIFKMIDVHESDEYLLTSKKEIKLNK